MPNFIKLGLKRILITNTHGGQSNKNMTGHFMVISENPCVGVLDSHDMLRPQSLSKAQSEPLRRLVRSVLLAFGIALCSASPAGQATTMQQELTPARYSTFLIGELQTSCLFSIALKESNVRYDAINRSSGAYGAWQIKNIRVKLLSPNEQVEWAIRYAQHRYGDACSAWSYWKRNYNW